MPNDDNIIPFRPRAAALSTCALPEYDTEYDDETLLDGDDGAPMPPVASRPYSVEVFGSEGGKSLLDACLPTHIAVAAMAFIVERLELPATP
jgi:hypothetical protein